MCYGIPIASDLACQYVQHFNLFLNDAKTGILVNHDELKQEFNIGLRLGSFLSEAGWMNESIQILSCLLPAFNILESKYSNSILNLDCLQRLLHAQASFCYFKDASITVKNAMKIINQLNLENIPNSLLANVYIQISMLHFLRSEYDLSYNWSIKALKRLRNDIPDK